MSIIVCEGCGPVLYARALHSLALCVLGFEAWVLAMSDGGREPCGAHVIFTAVMCFETLDNAHISASQPLWSPANLAGEEIVNRHTDGNSFITINALTPGQVQGI